MRNLISLLLFLSLLLGGCRPAASTALRPPALTLKPCTVAGRSRRNATHCTSPKIALTRQVAILTWILSSCAPTPREEALRALHSAQARDAEGSRDLV